MRFQIFLIGLFVLGGQSCTVIDKQFEDILKSPDRFHDEEIEITGIFHDQFEDFALYLTKDSDKDDALWVEFSETFMLLNTIEGSLDGHQVKIRGIFDKNDKGNLGLYSGSLKEAYLITLE